MASETIEGIIERLAGTVLSTDPDAPGLSALEPMLAELASAVGASGSAEAKALVEKAQQAIADLKAIAPVEALHVVSDVVARLQRVALSPATAASAAGNPGLAPRPVQRDEQTLELVRDFLQESGDGLGTADEILLNIETTGVTSEKVNALFRTFHTIKGVAGFLELAEIVSLAHATESLMNEVRDSKRKLEGEALEIVFTSTALMRKLLDGVRDAVQAGLSFSTNPETTPHVAKITELLAAAPASPPAPAAISAPVPQPVAPLPPPIPSSMRAPTASAPVAAPRPAPSSGPAPGASTPRPSAQPTAPQPSAPQPSAPGPVGGKLRETVKVDLERVDSMVEMIGELIIVESMLVHAPEVSGIGSLRIRNTLGQLGKISRELQNAAMRMRTVPVHNLFQRMARLAREVGKKAGREVVLVTEGDGTEMDRAMVERLEDPLVHMVRNACDHGIETPEAREQAGKPRQGTLTLTAAHKGGSVIIELSDDGKGLQRDVILQKAIEKGLVRSGEGLSDNDIFALIFAPGFSTAAKVTEVSGRGVGMDVVKRNVESMRGRVVISSEPGRGSTFRLVLPLTLAIIDGMLVTVGPERYLIPSLSIVEALQPKQSMLASMGERDELLTVRGQVMPMIRLSKLLNIEGARQSPTEALAVVVESVGKRVGLLVDHVVAQQQVVIKPLGHGVGQAEFYSGAAILSDGMVGLILNVDRICGLVSYRGHAQHYDSTRDHRSAEARS